MSLLLQVLLGIAVVIACLVVGKKLGTVLFGAKKDLTHLKRAAQALAIALREHGLRRLPKVLEEFTVGDVDDLMSSLKDFAIVVKSGNEAIVKELEGTFDRMLTAKLSTPEGRATVKARIELAEKIAIEAAKIAGPAIVTAAVAAL